jgi:hypothetical protein
MLSYRTVMLVRISTLMMPVFMLKNNRPFCVELHRYNVARVARLSTPYPFTSTIPAHFKVYQHPVFFVVYIFKKGINLHQFFTATEVKGRIRSK